MGELTYPCVTTKYAVSGVFSEVTQGLVEQMNGNASGNNIRTYTTGFDASDGNDIYSGSSVQVPALQVLACIKF